MYVDESKASAADQPAYSVGGGANTEVTSAVGQNSAALCHACFLVSHQRTTPWLYRGGGIRLCRLSRHNFATVFSLIEPRTAPERLAVILMWRIVCVHGASCSQPSALITRASVYGAMFKEYCTRSQFLVERRFFWCLEFPASCLQTPLRTLFIITVRLSIANWCLSQVLPVLGIFRPPPMTSWSEYERVEMFMINCNTGQCRGNRWDDGDGVGWLPMHGQGLAATCWNGTGSGGVDSAVVRYLNIWLFSLAQVCVRLGM